MGQAREAHGLEVLKFWADLGQSLVLLERVPHQGLQRRVPANRIPQYQVFSLDALSRRCVRVTRESSIASPGLLTGARIARTPESQLDFPEGSLRDFIPRDIWPHHKTISSLLTQFHPAGRATLQDTHSLSLEKFN